MGPVLFVYWSLLYGWPDHRYFQSLSDQGQPLTWLLHGKGARGTVLGHPRHMDENVEIIGLAAGVCTAISLLPQIVKVIREKKTNDISLFYLLVLLFGLGLWTYYGFLKDDLPIIATNIFSMILNLTMISLGIFYKRKT